jgi:hypothetical protein
MIYLPVGFVVFVLLLCPIIAMILLPIVGAVCLFYGFWWQGMAAFVFWFIVIWAWRYFRLNRFFEGPSYFV